MLEQKIQCEAEREQEQQQRKPKISTGELPKYISSRFIATRAINSSADASCTSCTLNSCCCYAGIAITPSLHVVKLAFFARHHHLRWLSILRGFRLKALDQLDVYARSYIYSSTPSVPIAHSEDEGGTE